MPQAIFAYHLGMDAEQYAFFRIPKLLITEPYFRRLSTDAKLLYGLMLDRMSLSMRNGWMDDDGHVYIYFTLEEACEQLCCKTDKAVKLFAELDSAKGVGLIRRVKQGLGRPVKIYVLRFMGMEDEPGEDTPKAEPPSCRNPDFGKTEVKSSEKPKSGPRKIRSQDLGKTECNKTDKNNTELSNTGSSTAKITLFNRQLNQKDFGRTLLMPMQGDRRDLYRNEYNALVLGKAAESNNLIQEKYITVSAEKKSVEEARAFFSRVGTDLTTGLSRMSSSVREITVNDRLRLLHDFYRPGEEHLFRFDLEDTIRKGHDFRDSIAPDCISFQKNHYELGDHVGRTLFLREYASFISDAMITELMDYPRNMMLSIDIIPVAMDEAVSDIRKRIMSVESDITRWQQRQNQSNNFTANIPYDLEQMRSETKEFMDDLMSRDQRMMLALVTLTHLADNLEQLDQDTEALQAIGRARGCQFNVLRYQQEDALNTVLPLGLKRIDAKIEPQEKSIIDRSVGNIYREYLKNYQGQPPTLKDLYDDLMKQVNPEAHRIALALELFTVGSLNVFSHQTNINTKSRILCFDIQDLGENLKSVGLLVMLDAIYNRVIQNRREGKYTHVYIDEIYLFFANGSGSGHSITNYSSEFLYKCWKRFRKYGATLTGITQNVEECLLSNTARMMFANSEFLLMLNQATTDREQLARLLGASDTQMSYVDNAPAGHGLIKVGGAIVPFANELPKNTELYRLMTTKPGED